MTDPSTAPPSPAPALPSGAVTFLLTDVEGSTRRWEAAADAMATAMERHDQIAEEIIARHHGVEPKDQGEGDSMLVVFARASDAVACAVELQLAFEREPWPAGADVRVRASIHTGEARLRGENYYGVALSRTARIRALASGAQVLLSNVSAELVRDHLPAGATLRDMGEHRLKDLERPERVFQLCHPDLPSEFPPLKSLDSRPNNLPIQLTSFVGRARELEEFRALLGSDARLITVTGAGGSGKTRLALQAAADAVDGFSAGVWLVELGALGDPALVHSTIASSLGLREEAGVDPFDAVADRLGTGAALLILDNCEHLVEAVADAAGGLLRRCAGLRVVATSRSVLEVTGETILAVSSLELPPPGARDAEAVAGSAAVRLFVERASRSARGFALNDENADAVGQICAQLDGLPLAIELAAARTNVLTPAQLVERLRDRFRVLSTGARTALPHQQTLRATVDWSYGLLSGDEQRHLRQLGVFAGGFALEAAEGVTGLDALDVLPALVSRSLVATEERDGEHRYRMLETIRAYALERLVEAGEEAASREAHLTYFHDLAASSSAELAGPQQRASLARLDREHDNFTAALAHAVDGADIRAVTLACALRAFWTTRGMLREARGWMERILPVAKDAAVPLRARALREAGATAFFQGDLAAAGGWYEESLAAARDAGDLREIAQTLNNLGGLAYREGAIERARALYEESLSLARSIESRPILADTLNNLGGVEFQHGRLDASRDYFAESLSIAREMGNDRVVASALSNLGFVASARGDAIEARALSEDGLALRRAIGDRDGIATSLANLGQMALAEGDLERARVQLEESVAIARDIGDAYSTADTLELLGQVAIAAGDPAGAAAILGESIQLARSAGAKPVLMAALRSAAALAGAQGDPARARDLREEAARIADELGNDEEAAALRALHEGA